jgi:hypothetical protein
LRPPSFRSLRVTPDSGGDIGKNLCPFLIPKLRIDCPGFVKCRS